VLVLVGWVMVLVAWVMAVAVVLGFWDQPH
jgi:hypothetical protein